VGLGASEPGAGVGGVRACLRRFVYVARCVPVCVVILSWRVCLSLAACAHCTPHQENKAVVTLLDGSLAADDKDGGVVSFTFVFLNAHPCESVQP